MEDRPAIILHNLRRVRRDAAANALYEVATDIDNYDDYLMMHNRAKRIEETP